MFRDEIRDHLEKKILPFWKALKDDTYGGFYGYMDSNLILNRTADKGCILNSRILWTFSAAAEALHSEELRAYADHSMAFLERFEDPDNGGMYWSVTYDGKPADTTKHTYCQAFAIYGLAAYYRLTGKQEALDKAMKLFRIIEGRCKDEGGYLEALKADFSPESNEKLSENGVMASRTMNTLLHVVEAYTELHRAHPDIQVMVACVEGLNQLLDRVYNPGKRRMDVFFDGDFRPLLARYRGQLADLGFRGNLHQAGGTGTLAEDVPGPAGERDGAGIRRPRAGLRDRGRRHKPQPGLVAPGGGDAGVRIRLADDGRPCLAQPPADPVGICETCDRGPAGRRGMVLRSRGGRDTVRQAGGGRMEMPLS